MDALDVETSLAAGEPALQALLQCARAQAGKLAAHEAEQRLFTRRRPMGLAAMQWSVAERGTGDVGPAITRADGTRLPRETPLRARKDGARFGTFAVARTGYRPAGPPGLCPLEAQVNRPARCDASCLQAWLTVCAVAPPCQERAGVFAQRFALEVAERVLMDVATEAPEDDDGCSAQRPGPPEDRAGALLVVRVDGQGVPMIKEAAVQRTAKVGPGAQRQQKQDALVGVRDTVEATPRSPAALAARLVAPAAARARRPRADTRDEAPRAQQIRRLARVGRTKPAVMAGIKAAVERREPQHRNPVVIRLDGARCVWHLATQRCNAWRRRTLVRDIRPVVGALWSAANAWCGDGSPAGTRWVQAKLAAIVRGRGGDVIGSRRQSLTKRQLRKAGRETRATVLTGFQNHRRWRPDEVDLAAGLPVGTGVVASACGAVVKPRREGEGKRWSLTGAEAMLALRSLQKSHDHDLRDSWRFRARQVRARLYRRQPNYRPILRMKQVA